jgi:integrase
MGSIPNTIRRGGIFHFRRAVPAALQRLFNRAELTCSLRTADVVLARRLSRCLYVCSEELFDVVGTAPMLSEQDIAALVKDFYSSILAQDEAARLMRDEPIPEERRAHYIEHYRQLAERSRIDLANSAFGSVRTISSTMLARRFGQDVQLEKFDARRVSHAMLRAGIEVAEALKARAEGDFNYEPKDKLLVAALQGPVEPPQATPQPEPLSIVPPTPPGPPFSEEADQFREAQLRRKVWEQQTGLQARKTYALFAEYFSDRPLASFTRRDAARFKELLEDLPANYGKAAEYRGIRAEQVVERSKSLDVQRLSPRTVQRHFAALASLWASVIEHGRADTNVFADWKFAASKRARDQRQMWEKDELQALFSSPVWTGCQSANRRSKPGSVILRDEKFWLPLIAVFSGMRQEEICQLRLTDVRQVEDIWIFDLNMRTGQQLKNANAIRQVPVHAELIRLGFLAYADEQRKTDKDLLFPNLQLAGRMTASATTTRSGSADTAGKPACLYLAAISTRSATAPRPSCHGPAYSIPSLTR